MRRAESIETFGTSPVTHADYIRCGETKPDAKKSTKGPARRSGLFYDAIKAPANRRIRRVKVFASTGAVIERGECLPVAQVGAGLHPVVIGRRPGDAEANCSTGKPLDGSALHKLRHGDGKQR